MYGGGGDSIEDDFGDRSEGDERIEYDEDGDEDPACHGTTKSMMVQNQPHDEEVALSDTDSFGGKDAPPDVHDASLIESHDMDELPGGGAATYAGQIRAQAASNVRVAAPTSGQAASVPIGQEARPGRLAGVAQETGTEAAGESDAGDGTAQGGYNALEFKNLNVSEDIRTLFQYIGRYKPQTIDLETRLKPFIPDYIPAVGGLDEFIKAPRPDGKPDFLGLKVLDEPAARQSDPTVLTLQLRQLSKEAPGNKAEMIGRIEHGDEQKVKKVQQWISSINDIHKNKPAAVVSYSRTMPDIEALMQEWPPEMESFIRNMKLPSGELDLDLKSFTKLMCSLLDIPMYENPVESLHVLFSLYDAFRSNPIFSQMGQGGGLGDTMGGLGGTMMTDGGASGVNTPIWQHARQGEMSAGSSMGTLSQSMQRSHLEGSGQHGSGPAAVVNPW
mmetsp:Transcript_20907/g.35699  ORF Transcript_20907/g.35699 Transcript_20907/m.35699 type:complete len:444 (-) Transcript_20907:57-1388(-)|eukprot:CAMPEP_0119113318 /NCGR_PEP_ID=MMETSP1180-20130426/43515_1 /TAXON_ID=3052 ORGANISM="Chlamydomonas cf sp, Strain CCMP681" /NCGR_SAMPLE_ID=MMETSP1180 /ASSEMBLY_ACC=CAM_ASM_000741 /LENGTH=443 /DNA_ID=CAMNT_0007101301 /DNA_START=33 /DNA_END=1364 /DNA_ORIENTATION=-